MPFTTLLWSHYGVSNQVTALHRQVDELQGHVDDLQDELTQVHQLLGRITETLCACDSQLAFSFGLDRGQRSHFSGQGGGGSSSSSRAATGNRPPEPRGHDDVEVEGELPSRG